MNQERKEFESAQVGSYIDKELASFKIPRGPTHDELRKRISDWYYDWLIVSARFTPYGTDHLPEDQKEEVDRLFEVFAERLISHMTRGSIHLITLMVLDQELTIQEVMEGQHE